MAINLLRALGGALYLSLKLSAIIIILTIAYEIYENSKLYRTIKQLAGKPLKKIGISSNASTTMIAGFLLGIAYGSAVLIKDSMENKMSYTDIILSAVFLSICHAIIEDTLIFVVIGANGIVLFGSRMMLALIIVTILNKMLQK
ncbi:MAG: nucleoside recognition protein [Epsilonproteobacteria bacterium]|nr:nucleoside recognition protein [Campylobacterota bacterium]